MAKARASSLEKQRKILMAALDCFTQHGLQGATIEMIRDASGASIGSLYHHFGNKDQIAAALYLQGMIDHNKHINAALEQAEEAEEGVKRLVMTYAKWVTDNADWARFLFHSRSDVLTEKDAAELSKANREQFRHLMTWFLPQIEAGYIKELPQEIYFSLIIGPCHEYARHWLSGRMKKPLLEVAPWLADGAWCAIKGPRS